MEIRSFPADAVIVASGGCGLIYGRSTMSMVCTGSAASRCYQAGAKYANGEFIQVHPTAIPGADKLRLMSESARGEGGRVWVPGSHRIRVLQRRFPKASDTISGRAISQVRQPRAARHRDARDFQRLHPRGAECRKGPIGGLPRSHAYSAADLDLKLGGIFGIYEKFQGVDPRNVPMKIFPAVHYSMGGLWVDYEKNATGGLNVGSPKPADEHPGSLCDRRMRLSIPRCESAGRQLAIKLYFQRTDHRAGHCQSIKVAQRWSAADQPASLYEAAKSNKKRLTKDSCDVPAVARTHT